MKNNGLRAFARYSATTLKIVPSSLVTQRNKPKDGLWSEVPYTLCCSAYTEIRATIEDPAITSIIFDIFCDGTGGEYWLWLNGRNTTTMQEIADLGNEFLSFLGEFSVDGSQIVLKLKQELYDGLQCDGDVIFQIYAN